MGDRSYSFDANLLLADGAAAMTATGAAQVSGAAGVIDLGGIQSVTPVQQARIDAALVIFLQGITTANTNNVYTVTLQGSNDPAFASATCQTLGAMDFGNATARNTLNGIGTNAILTAAPLGSGLFGQVPADTMYELMFTNEQSNTKFQYIRLWVTIAGTSASIQFMAFVAVIPEP